MKNILLKLMNRFEELKVLAEEADISEILAETNQEVLDLARLAHPSNFLAHSLIEDSSTIHCQISQAEYLSNCAAAIVNSLDEK